MADLIPMNINPGDPVTSDLISTIVTNINTINAAKSSGDPVIINAGTATGGSKISQTVVSTRKTKIKTAVTSSPSAGPFTWTFDTAFKSAPACWVQLDTLNATMTNGAVARLHAVVTSVSTTGMSWEIRSGASAVSGYINATLFAAGELA